MVKLINRNGSVMYAHESRMEEYLSAGYIKAETPKVEKKEPVPVIMPKAELKEEPKRGLVKPEAEKKAKKPDKKSKAKK